MTTQRELSEDGARRGGMPNGQCSKGWGARCAHGTGRRCRCACGGANHGSARAGVTHAGSADAHVVVDEGNRHARFAIVGSLTDNACVTIRDLGPWDQHQSVTNDADWVVAKVRTLGLGTRRLFYFDSGNRLDELLVRDGQFAGFAPGPEVVR